MSPDRSPQRARRRRQMPAPPSPSAAALRRLAREPNLWLATVRASGSPHMVPLWFVYEGGYLHICTDPRSAKVRNVRRHPMVVAALEGGDQPVIAYGTAEIRPRPWPKQAVAAFKRKYDWDIEEGDTYTCLLTIRPSRWMEW